jgi:anti-sigma B factor antagonist
MEITQRLVGDVTILDLQGKLIIGEGAELLSDTVKKLVSQGKPRVLVNLSQVPYVDSGGLGELVHCMVSAKNAGGALKLTGVTGKITDLLAITRLVTVFDTFETERDALASYGAVPVKA